MKPLSFIEKNRLEIIIVIMLFLIAFGVRTIPSDKFPNIYGFDSYFGARMNKYMITGEKPGWPIAGFQDITTDYPWGRYARASEAGWWTMNTIIYTFAGGGTPFNYDLFGAVASWMVAILASLAIPAVYLFGKIAYNRITGLASALFLTASSGHLFYSIFGHAENDGFGLTLFFLCLFSFVLTVKKKNWKYGVLTTIFFSWLSITWPSYSVVVMLASGTVVAYFIISLIMKYTGYYQDTAEKKETRKWMINALLFAAVSGVFGYLFTGTIGNSVVGIIPLTGAALIAIIIELVTKNQKLEVKNLKNIPMRQATAAILLVIIALGTYGTAAITSPAGFAGQSIGASPQLNLLPYEKRMSETIAEQNPIGGNNFFERITTLSGNFGLAIWLAVFSVGIILAKLFTMPFIRKDFTYEWDILALAFILLSLWTLTEKAITTFFLAGTVAFGAGYFMGAIHRFIEISSKKYENISQYAGPAVIITMLLMFFSYNVITVQGAESFGYDVPQEWFQTFDFLNTVPNGSVVTAWWDYGHWMNYFNGDNIHTSLDNIQDRKDIIYTVASSFTHTTPCKADSNQTFSCETSEEELEKAELESLSILKPLGTNYILIDKEIAAGATGGKFGALAYIANSQVGCVQEFGCQNDTNGNVFCVVGQAQNGEKLGYAFSKEQWSSLAETGWPGTAATIPVYLLNETMPVAGEIQTRYFAKNQDYGGKSLYAAAAGCGDNFFRGGANPTAPILYTFLHRLFFSDPMLKHVEKVYEDGWNVIYKVNWSGVPDPMEYTEWTKSRSVLCTGEAKGYCERFKQYAEENLANHTW